MSNSIFFDHGADSLHRRTGEGCDREGDVFFIGAAKQLVQFGFAQLRIVPVTDALRAQAESEKLGSFCTK